MKKDIEIAQEAKIRPIAEIDLLIKHCVSQKVEVAINESWSRGGAGAIDLAENGIITGLF